MAEQTEQETLSNDLDSRAPESLQEPTEISNLFLRLKEHGRFSRTRALRLKENDIVVALDGKLFHDSIEKLADNLSDEEEEYWILTIYRAGVLFDISTRGPLGGTFDYCSASEANQIENALKEHTFHKKEDYKIFEVLKDLHKSCDIYDTSYNSLAVYMPPLWLMQQRMWEPLVAILAVYLITLNVNIFLFILAVILISIYFKKGQLIIRRSYSMYQDRQVWVTLAAINELEAQKMCRNIDPKCKFSQSLVGPPKVEPKTNGKKRKRSGNLMPV